MAETNFFLGYMEGGVTMISTKQIAKALGKPNGEIMAKCRRIARKNDVFRFGTKEAMEADFYGRIKPVYKLNNNAFDIFVGAVRNETQRKKLEEIGKGN